MKYVGSEAHPVLVLHLVVIKFLFMAIIMNIVFLSHVHPRSLKELLTIYNSIIMLMIL